MSRVRHIHLGAKYLAKGMDPSLHSPPDIGWIVGYNESAAISTRRSTSLSTRVVLQAEDESGELSMSTWIFQQMTLCFDLIFEFIVWFPVFNNKWCALFLNKVATSVFNK